MFRRIAVVAAVVVGAAGMLAVPAEGQDDLADAAELADQDAAAEQVMEQLDDAEAPVPMEDIEALDDLGPAPWLSFMPGRSDDVVEAWTEVAQQLPGSSMGADRRGPRGPRGPIAIAESEDPGGVGGNDTPATGDRIRGFGTRGRQSRLVTIDGNLSGAPDGVPISLDCPSEEDDGAIGLANEPGPNVNVGALCGGEIGDGPHGSTTGDTDFYAFGAAALGDLLVLDVAHLSEPLRPIATTVGIYTADGTLVASADDAGDPTGGEFLLHEVTEAGEYFGVVVGAGDLPSDPFDPASGAGVTETGSYEMFVAAIPAPCASTEDDGSIGLANDSARSGLGDDELFVAECSGLVGDGPQVATGDVDFFTTREMAVGKVLVVDLVDPDPASTAGEFVIGVYSTDGRLLAQGNDSPDPSDANFFTFTVPETAVYHVVIGGGLPIDPTDSTTGTNTDIVGPYTAFLVDITQELLDEIVGGDGDGDGADADGGEAGDADGGAAGGGDASGVAWRAGPGGQEPSPAAVVKAMLKERTAEVMAAVDEEPVVDVDVFLVRLRAGDAISGGFDAARITGIIDPSGVGRHASPFNPSFIYPADSPLRHERRVGFDHVATETGVHAVFVSEGNGPYQGELRVARAGLADERTRGQQTIFLDFDGAAVSPSVFGAPGGEPIPPQELSPLSTFLPAWGLGTADEDAVIDATIDAVIENLDTDLRVVDGRNGDRDSSRRPREFDIEILNSRDHGDRWGDENVSRIVIGGTIDELQVPTIGIAQSIDPGNQETEETGVVLLDLLSGPAGDPISLNSYEVAPGFTKADLIGYAVGHITAHEIGHYIGNWHTETFNEQVSLMDAGGEFQSVFGVGADGVFGTADDVDADFAEDVFSTVEGFAGVEDTAGRSVFGLSTGSRRPLGRPGPRP